jgi:hypothetical protein
MSSGTASLRSGGAGALHDRLGLPTAKNNPPLSALWLDVIGCRSSYSLQSDRRKGVLSHIRILHRPGDVDCGIESRGMGEEVWARHGQGWAGKHGARRRARWWMVVVMMIMLPGTQISEPRGRLCPPLPYPTAPTLFFLCFFSLSQCWKPNTRGTD